MSRFGVCIGRDTGLSAVPLALRPRASRTTPTSGECVAQEQDQGAPGSASGSNSTLYAILNSPVEALFDLLQAIPALASLDTLHGLTQLLLQLCAQLQPLVRVPEKPQQRLVHRRDDQLFQLCLGHIADFLHGLPPDCFFVAHSTIAKEAIWRESMKKVSDMT